MEMKSHLNRREGTGALGGLWTVHRRGLRAQTRSWVDTKEDAARPAAGPGPPADSRNNSLSMKI